MTPDHWIATIPPAVLARPVAVEDGPRPPDAAGPGPPDPCCPLCAAWLYTQHPPTCPTCGLALDWQAVWDREAAAWEAAQDALRAHLAYEPPPDSDAAVEAAESLAMDVDADLTAAQRARLLDWILDAWDGQRGRQ